MPEATAPSHDQAEGTVASRGATLAAASANERAELASRGRSARKAPTTLAFAAQPEADMLSVPAPTVTAEPTRPATPEPTPEPTPTPRPVRTAAPRTPAPAPAISTDVAAAELQMLALMNASRARGGLAPLAMDARVAQAARLHSQAEAEVGYVYHDGPDGTAKSRNVPACGTGWYGENTGKIWNGNVAALNIEFMNEPWEPINHRTNIMDPNFVRVGVGAVQGRDALYMTMVFCR